MEKEIQKLLYKHIFDKSKIPQKVYDNIKKYAPNYKHIIYDDKECIDFIQKLWRKYVEKFNSLKEELIKQIYLDIVIYIKMGVFI